MIVNMKKWIPLFFCCCLALSACQNNAEPGPATAAKAAPTATEDTGQTTEAQPADQGDRPDYVLVIHGGAGSIRRGVLSPEREKSIRQALQAALDAGEAVLKAGGSSIDAVQAAIIPLENSLHFNAGKGAVFTHDGTNEMDASIMDGATMDAGAVGGVTILKNPIVAARAVMEKSPHVLLTRKGAETFATENGVETVDPSYFFVQDRWETLQSILDEENKSGSRYTAPANSKYGTVGAVALDRQGNLAAGTSTGGMTNKRWGRIGDSPIIGAGTYASNATCALSCTGHGEYYIRYAVAHDVSALMEYKELSLSEAADRVINEKLVKVGGAGGIIGVDARGNVAMPFNTSGMYRGYVKSTGEQVIEMYKEEE